MRHRKRHFKLKRTAGHRIALLRSLATSLLRHGRIRTTCAKAKAARPFVEKLITKARRGGLHNRRLVASHIHDRGTVKKLFDVLAARYAQRPGGYTRILKLGPRGGDRAEMALLELVSPTEKTEEGEPEAKPG
jgi:large subunit ribosomal protein L17